MNGNILYGLYLLMYSNLKQCVVFSFMYENCTLLTVLSKLVSNFIFTT